MPDQRLFECLLLIKNAPQFAPFREWLLEEQLSLGERLISANDTNEMRLTQGGARFVRKLNELIDSAEKRLEQNRR